DAPGAPHKVSLGGTGVAASPALAWIPAATAVDFGDASVGTPSTPRSLTLSNQGPGSITLTQIGLAGADAADFHLDGSGTCSATTLLAQGATCSVALAFQPGAAGPRTATLHIAASGSSPPDLTLHGNGTALAQPAIAVTPAALGFDVPAGADTAAPQTVTIQSTGGAVLRVSAIRIAAGSFTVAASATQGCPAAPFDLMPGASCAVDVGWSSTRPGTESGLLEIDSDAGSAATQIAIQATRAAEPEISNVGAGGCSLARGDTLADPTLWLLMLAAMAVLWHRRRKS
ncbi:MAG TPA: choice-of-anchor D domain-containing protein, partial [Burkholderiaceae bacterium]|nr:choice-of-anchor D domain-containing protein [Burkholderiaceae bacterium]